MTEMLLHPWTKESNLLRNPYCLSAGTASLLYLQFKPTIWAMNHSCKHTNCIISNQERHFFQFCWNWPTSPLQSYSLDPPKFNVDKQTPKKESMSWTSWFRVCESWI